MTRYLILNNYYLLNRRCDDTIKAMFLNGTSCYSNTSKIYREENDVLEFST